MSYQPKVYRKQGGDIQIVASGGEIDVESGGSLKLAGTALTPTAAEINKLAGVVAGTVTASKVVIVGANKEIDVIALPVSGLKIGSGAGTAMDATAAELNRLASVTAGTVAVSKGVVTGTAKQVDTLAVATLVTGVDAAGGAATQKTEIIVKKTGIADNTATDILTVTVPNANHAAAIRLTLLATLGAGTDTFESSRAASGIVVLARQTGANVAATAIALTNAGIATVSGGGTLTLAYDLSSIVGAVGAVNTFTIRVTLVVTGTITNHQLVVLAEVINAEASGVTVAAA